MNLGLEAPNLEAPQKHLLQPQQQHGLQLNGTLPLLLKLS